MPWWIWSSRSRGCPTSEHLRIAFRDFNFARDDGEDAIVFPSGQQEILFLVPYKIPRRKKDVEKYKDLFTLYKGRQGRYTLPAEGPGIILEAVRSLARVSEMDAATQIDALRGFLDSPNPFLVEVSLSEIERLRAADTTLLNRLTSFFRSPGPSLRNAALRVVVQVFGSMGADGGDLPDEARSARALVLERARNDTDESVRAQAVTALAAWPKRSEVEGDLRAIAATDAAQAVRYEAQRALFKP